jgi:hypothetical protein
MSLAYYTELVLVVRGDMLTEEDMFYTENSCKAYKVSLWRTTKLS